MNPLNDFLIWTPQERTLIGGTFNEDFPPHIPLDVHQRKLTIEQAQELRKE